MVLGAAPHLGATPDLSTALDATEDVAAARDATQPVKQQPPTEPETRRRKTTAKSVPPSDTDADAEGSNRGSVSPVVYAGFALAFMSLGAMLMYAKMRN